MEKFTHYLITRFNVPVPGWSADKSGTPTLDPAWMAHRLRIFATYCVPTVAAQSEKNFHWLIGVDARTSAADLTSIGQLVHDIPRTELLSGPDFVTWMVTLRARLSADPAPYIITSRVDNDDGLGPHFIRAMQAGFTPTDGLLLNPPDGLVYDPRHHLLTRQRRARLNHFGSLIEANRHDGGLRTVLGFPHHQPPADIRVRDIDLPDGWLKIVHDRNVTSRMKGRPVLRLPEAFRNILLPGAIRISIPQTIAYVGRRLVGKIMSTPHA